MMRRTSESFSRTDSIVQNSLKSSSCISRRLEKMNEDIILDKLTEAINKALIVIGALFVAIKMLS